MNQSTLTERITRSLAYMLRHQPEEFDLELDSHGYAEIGDVVRALNERLGEPIEEDDLTEAIGSGDRPRYEIREGSIRALYGHSFPIDPGEASDPPELLYVGVGSRDADRAERHGLKGGRRAFLHLALTEEDALETGRRIAPEYTVITVRAREASEDGVAFYDRQALFLAESIPTECIEVGEIHTDGIVRERRGDRSGRDRGPRGRGRDGDRGRGRDRDRNSGGRGRDRDERPRDSGERPRDRDERPRDRDERPRREEPAPAARREPSAPMPSERESRPKSGSPSFGLGIEEAPPKKSRRPDPAPEPQRKPEPKPKPEPSPPKDSGPAFGAGL